MVLGVFGEGPALEYLDKEIKEASNGADELAKMGEAEMVNLLGRMQFGNAEDT